MNRKKVPIPCAMRRIVRQRVAETSEMRRSVAEDGCLSHVQCADLYGSAAGRAALRHRGRRVRVPHGTGQE
jgi:hypothetical protein